LDCRQRRAMAQWGRDRHHRGGKHGRRQSFVAPYLGQLSNERQSANDRVRRKRDLDDAWEVKRDPCTLSLTYTFGLPRSATNDDCYVGTNNVGCGVSYTSSSTPNSYGAGLNQIGGGWYAMQRSSASGIYIWFWPHTSNNVPDDVLDGKSTVDTATWGTPGT
jgi:hypothetical protein